MRELEDKIRTFGKALNEDVLLVDMFLNHQVDCELMDHIGDEFARLFADAGITRVATVEASGIAPALMCALKMRVPLLVLKKSASAIMNENVLQTEVFSFTKQKSYLLTMKQEYMLPGDRVLLIDDFLANGEAALGASRLIEQAGGSVAAIGIVIEKSFQPGRALLTGKGYRVISLARVAKMGEGFIEFAEADA
ncbi:MAG: xanthine phosphoribosyltransferase [Clostridia bacterium]|nr:xanthine phosphoribosyltransferase [Clostridia bacterium]